MESYTSDLDFHGGGIRKFLYPFKIIYSVEARKKIRLVLEDFGPDVVHLNNINFQLTPSIIYEIRAYEKKHRKRVRIVYTAHDYQWVCPNHMMRVPSTGEICFACRGGDYKQCSMKRCIHNSRIKSLLGTMEAKYYAKRKTYDLVDVIVCPSEFMKKQLDTDPLLAGKTVMMHNFIEAQGEQRERMEAVDEAKNEHNTDFIPAKGSEVTRNGKDYVVYFGRFSEEKGTATLLKACRALPGIPFVFAGTGPLESLVNRVPNVENRGFLQGEELRRLIAGARFSVYPSEWYENCPFSVMESQVYGTPVLASDLGGAPELVQAGKTGDLFRGGDVQELTEHIRALWEEPALCREYSENCKNIKFDTIREYCDKIVKNVYART